MKPTEEQITRWIDGELLDYEREEFEAYLKDHPELLAEKEAADQSGRLLRDSLPSEVEPPYADFFNSQIQRQIRRTEMDPATPVAPRRPGVLPRIASWFRSPLGALGAAAAAAIITFVSVKSTDAPDSSPPNQDNTLVTSIYTPDESVSVSSFFSEEAGASVIIVDGLEEIPASYEIKGNLAGNAGLDNSVASDSGWRTLPSDDAVVNWVDVSFRGTGVSRHSL